MGQIIDELLSFLGINQDNSNEDLDDYGSSLDIDELEHGKSFGLRRNYNDCIKCEQEIIKCRKKHGRVLGIESKVLRQRFGDTCVNRALYRTSQRKYRGHCDVQEEDDNFADTLQTIAKNLAPVKEENSL